MRKIYLLLASLFIVFFAQAQLEFKARLLNGLELKPVVGITVKLKEVKTDKVVVAVTDVNGIAAFGSLPPGKYIVLTDEGSGYFGIEEEVNIQKVTRY